MWNSIKDKQPELEQRVLFCQKNSGVVIYKYVYDEVFLWEPDDNEGGHAFYIKEDKDFWMELPESIK